MRPVSRLRQVSTGSTRPVFLALTSSGILVRRFGFRCRHYSDRQCEPLPVSRIRHRGLIHSAHDLRLPPMPQQPTCGTVYSRTRIMAVPAGQLLEECDLTRLGNLLERIPSNSRRNRVTAIQKSSRTITTHCTRPPSHCRRACTSSEYCSSFRACNHCSNWSSTISTFLPCGIPCTRRNAAIVALRLRLSSRAETTLSQAIEETALGFLGCGLDVNGDHVFGESRQQPRFDE